MDDELFLITFPAFVLFSSEDGTPLAHRQGEKKVIPLFTDLDSAKTFVERRTKPCKLAILPDREEMRRFLSCFKPDDEVAMDPLREGPTVITTYKIANILKAL
jgi:hypothetical protein